MCEFYGETIKSRSPAIVPLKEVTQYRPTLTLFSQGSLPLCIPLSSLSDGVNEIVLQVTGNEGTQRVVTFTIG